MAGTFWGWRQASVAMVFTVAVSGAYLNSRDEISDLQRLRHTTLLWMTMPAIILLFYLVGTVLTRNAAFNYRPVIVTMVIYAIIHASYALNGPTGPDTAAGMHIIFVPALLGIASIPILLLVVWRIVFYIRRPPAEVNRISSNDTPK